MRVNKGLRKFAKDNDYRLVTMSVQTPDGNEMSQESCVTVEDSLEVCKMFTRIFELSSKTEIVHEGK